MHDEKSHSSLQPAYLTPPITLPLISIQPSTSTLFIPRFRLYKNMRRASLRLTSLLSHFQLRRPIAILQISTSHPRGRFSTMAPTSQQPEEFEYIVIGGGSGGSGAARRAAGWYGKKTLLIENGISGGCCVNVG
jgi:hypothetical protein